MYVVIYCSFIFSLCIFIFYFSSEILAKFSYSVNPRLNKVYVCMYVFRSDYKCYKCYIFAQLHAHLDSEIRLKSYCKFRVDHKQKRITFHSLKRYFAQN